MVVRRSRNKSSNKPLTKKISTTPGVYTLLHRGVKKKRRCSRRHNRPQVVCVVGVDRYILPVLFRRWILSERSVAPHDVSQA